jgi:hypothetical protein
MSCLVLSCLVLCCVVWCCVVLCGVVWCCVVLCCVVLCCVVLCCVMSCLVLSSRVGHPADYRSFYSPWNSPKRGLDGVFLFFSILFWVFGHGLDFRFFILFRFCFGSSGMVLSFVLCCVDVCFVFWSLAFAFVLVLVLVLVCECLSFVLCLVHCLVLFV